MLTASCIDMAIANGMHQQLEPALVSYTSIPWLLKYRQQQHIVSFSDQAPASRLLSPWFHYHMATPRAQLQCRRPPSIDHLAVMPMASFGQESPAPQQSPAEIESVFASRMEGASAPGRDPIRACCNFGTQRNAVRQPYYLCYCVLRAWYWHTRFRKLCLRTSSSARYLHCACCNFCLLLDLSALSHLCIALIRCEWYRYQKIMGRQWRA